MSFFCSRIPLRTLHHICRVSIVGFLLLACLFLCFLTSWHSRVLQVPLVFSHPSPRSSRLPESLSVLQLFQCNRCCYTGAALVWWLVREHSDFSDTASVFQGTCVSGLWALQLFRSVFLWLDFLSTAFLQVEYISEFCSCKVISPGAQTFLIEKAL